jgi:hypothetical protein
MKMSRSRSWRDLLPIHPAAALFPRMLSNELRELSKDIRKNGLRSSIALWQSDKGASALLLDGISRLDGQLIWEPACGAGRMAEARKAAGATVYCSDVESRGFARRQPARTPIALPSPSWSRTTNSNKWRPRKSSCRGR